MHCLSSAIRVDGEVDTRSVIDPAIVLGRSDYRSETVPALSRNSIIICYKLQNLLRQNVGCDICLHKIISLTDVYTFQRSCVITTPIGVLNSRQLSRSLKYILPVLYHVSRCVITLITGKFYIFENSDFIHQL